VSLLLLAVFLGSSAAALADDCNTTAPGSAYQVCTSNATWAQCLDVNCTIPSPNATMATCACKIVRTETSGIDWIIVRDTYDPAPCANPPIIISSATRLE
jgi:hypothetical protein